MPFWKRKPKRLYVPVKSSWYTRPRRKGAVKTRNATVLEKRGMLGFVKEVVSKSAFWVVSVLGVVCLFMVLFFSSYFSIKSIEVDRENFNIDSAKIENSLGVFVGKNLIFFPKSRIQNLVLKGFPEFSGVEIKKLFPSKIKIKLTSFPVVANLRAYYVLPPAEEPAPEDFTELNKAIEELSTVDPTILSAQSNPLEDKNASKGIFSLDGKGEGPVASEQKGLLNEIGQALFDQEENLELMSIVVRGLTQPVEDREFAIPTKTMEYIMGAVRYFTNAVGLEVLSVEYFTFANEIHLKAKNGLVVWLSVDRDFKVQLDKLKTIYEPAELNKVDLAYIDLRVKEKVIYCLRGTRCDKKAD